MRPLSADDPFIGRLAAAVAEVRARIPVEGWPPPGPAELTALCNAALRLCVTLYEGDPLFTTLLLFGEVVEHRGPGFMRFAVGPEWRAIARGFPEGIATRVEQGALQPFAGLTVPLTESSAEAMPLTRALVLPGVVGVSMGGELLAELRPGQPPEFLAAPRPSLENLLREAGLPALAPLRPAHLRRLLRAARHHRHGASVIVTTERGPLPDALPLAGAAVEWTELRDALSIGGENSAEAGRLADALGRLTAIDGALVLTHEGHALGFGLRLGATADPGSRVLYSDRLGDAPRAQEGGPATGARRRSAVDYVTSHANCFALVLSSDGPLSLSYRRDNKTVVVQLGLECLL